MKIAILAARLLVAGVFLYAGILKLGASERFTITVAQMGFLPEGWAFPFARALPWAELAAGLLLLVPWTARVGALFAALLLGVFLIALTWAWMHGLAVDCGCFGESEDSYAGGRNQIFVAMARDVALLAVTLLLAARRLR